MEHNYAYNNEPKAENNVSERFPFCAIQESYDAVQWVIFRECCRDDNPDDNTSDGDS